MLLTIAQVRDLLVELEDSELTLERRREIVAALRDWLTVREGQHAMQELLERIETGIRAPVEEMALWRPSATRLMNAEARALEQGTLRTREQMEAWVWWRQILTPQTIAILIAILASALGVRVSLPGGVGAGATVEVSGER